MSERVSVSSAKKPSASKRSFRIGRVKSFLRGEVWRRRHYENGERRGPRVGREREAAKQLAAQINGQLEVGAPSALSFEPIAIAQLRERWLERREYVLRSSVATIRRRRAASLPPPSSAQMARSSGKMRPYFPEREAVPQPPGEPGDRATRRAPFARRLFVAETRRTDRVEALLAEDPGALRPRRRTGARGPRKRDAQHDASSDCKGLSGRGERRRPTVQTPKNLRVIQAIARPQECANDGQGGTRTRTPATRPRILSPICLPIPSLGRPAPRRCYLESRRRRRGGERRTLRETLRRERVRQDESHGVRRENP